MNMSDSDEIDSEISEESLHSEISKLKLKDAVVYYLRLLSDNNLIAAEGSNSISLEAMLIGQEIFDRTMDIVSENLLIKDVELFHENECYEGEPFEDDDSSTEYQPQEKRSRDVEQIPLDYKIKVLNIAKAHPTWSLQTLQRKGCSRLKRKEYLSRWEEDVKKGGNTFDKYAIIDSWTYDRFLEARENCQQVTTRNLQQWALSAATQFRDFEFKASDRWVGDFKKKHKIRQRKITKYVSKKETASIEETLASADTFRVQTLKLIPNFEKDFVINTDQTGKHILYYI